MQINGSIRMEDRTARKLKIAAAFAGLPAGKFLDVLLDDWAAAAGLEFVIKSQVIHRGDAADGREITTDE